MRNGAEGGRIDLHQAFLRIQEQMLANLNASRVYDHRATCGAVSERQWIDLFHRYLPERYRATSAFVVDAEGARSRQIDIAIYDRFYSPLLFPDDVQPYIPAESVYAVFECKQDLSTETLCDAAAKAASVRRLRRTSAPVLCAGSVLPPRAALPIVAGILCLGDADPAALVPTMTSMLPYFEGDKLLDLGCSLRQGTFEISTDGGSEARVRYSLPGQALIFFLLRLLSRLQQMGTAPPMDLDEYARKGRVGWSSPEAQGTSPFRRGSSKARMCSECGGLMTRNGSCYKCENCGGTSGCS